MITKSKTHSLFEHFNFHSVNHHDKSNNNTFQHQSSKKQTRFPLQEFIDFSNKIKSNRKKKVNTCLDNFLNSQKNSYQKYVKSNVCNQEKEKISNRKKNLLSNSPLYKQNSAKNQNKICQSPDDCARKQNQKILQSLRLENQKYRRMIKENQFLNDQKETQIKPFSIFQFDGLSLTVQNKKPIQFHQKPDKHFQDFVSCALTNSFIFQQVAEKIQVKKQNSSNLKKQDFQKIKFLGKGNFGEVNLVRHKKTNFLCAMKEIKKSFVRQQKVQHQISRQIRIHQSLKHLNIIAFYGFFDDSENIYILIQYATGGQLFKRLKQCQRMPQTEIGSIIKDAIDGLRMIHKLGYIHRDLKPQNMIFQFGIGKICDLGWAVQCKQNQTRKSYCGTPLYLPPEMIKKQNYDSGADIWSIGILTYQLLVGKIPFNIWSQYDLMQIVQRQIKFPTSYVDISPQCMDFIKRCLNKDPTKRIKLQQLYCHQFLKKNTEINYFNIQIYNALNMLFP